MKIPPLPPPDRFYLAAAEGWLGLGCAEEAAAEWEPIRPEFHQHAQVMEVRWQILAKLKRWESAVETARQMMVHLPKNPFGAVHLAYSLHELKQTQAAWEALLPAAAKCPKHFLIAYNLACYACQLAFMPEALDWLAKAMRLAGKESILPMALADPDLKPLWEQIRKL